MGIKRKLRKSTQWEETSKKQKKMRTAMTRNTTKRDAISGVLKEKTGSFITKRIRKHMSKDYLQCQKL